MRFILLGLFSLLAFSTFAQNTPSAFIQQLSYLSHCTPQEGHPCYVRVANTLELLKFLQHCTQLKNWVIVYSPQTQTHIQVMLTNADENNCTVTVADTSKNPIETKTCPINESDIQAIVSSPTVKQYLANYDQVQQLPEDVMKQIFASFYACMKGNVNPIFLGGQ